MHESCDSETIDEFGKCIVDLINVNNNNIKYKCVENDVILRCPSENLNMKEKQIVNCFILNATWIVLK